MTPDRNVIEGGGCHEALLRGWLLLAKRLGARGDALAAGRQVLRCYEQPHRRYHNLRHLAECIELADEVADQLADADAARCALYFHDAVYTVGAADNEVRSAEMARRMLMDLGLPDRRGGLIERLIQCTDHRTPPFSSDARYVVDIDLSILGQPADRYTEYAEAIQAEAALPPEEFRQRRVEFLRNMLARPRLFFTETFAARFEAAARANMRRELDSLQRRPS